MLIKQIIILISLSGLLACAGGTEAPEEEADRTTRRGSDCIMESSIRGYSVLDESNLVVSAGGRRQYHVTLARRAYGLRSSWGIAFDSSTGRVCPGFSEVVFDDNMSGGSIRIQAIRELSPEDHEDLLIQFGKKEPEIKQAPAPADVKGAEVEELDPVDSGESSGN